MSTVDERLTMADAEAMKTQGAADLEASNKMYDDMVAANEKSKDDALGLIDNNKTEQEKIANEQTDFAIEKIEQEREWAKKDYTKEQSGAYADWQKQSNQYGVNAEQKASMGMAGTGYSESSQVSMYNQYQNRIAVARESYLRADAEFVNAMKDARLQNSAVLAQIAAETLKQKLEITLTYAQQNNTLLQNKANAATQIKAQTHANYMDVLGAIYQQDALEESARHNKAVEEENARQFNETMAYQKQKDQAAASSSGSSGGGSIKKTSSKSSITSRAINSVNARKGITNTKKNVVEQVFNNAKKEKESSEPTIDMNSVLALGYGPISASRLNQLVKEGKVVKYVEGNKIKFRPSVNGR